MEKLEYYEGFYVIKNEEETFLQKSPGRKPDSRNYDYTEMDIFERQKKDWQHKLFLSKCEIVELKGKLLTDILGLAKPISKDRIQEIEWEQDISNVIAFLPKQTYFDLLYSYEEFREIIN